VFLLRHIVHNWPTSAARKILLQLSRAATPSTRLVIIDAILPYTTSTSAPLPLDNIPGVAHANVPSPLLSSTGEDNTFNLSVLVSTASLVQSNEPTDQWQMMSMFMAQERTIGEYVELFQGSGWKLAHVVPTPLKAPAHLILVLSDEH
jgi:hypothetical protein